MKDTADRTYAIRIEVQYLIPLYPGTAEYVGMQNIGRRLEATREPGRRIRRRMPWHQKIARLTVFCLIWMLALWWVFFL